MFRADSPIAPGLPSLSPRVALPPDASLSRPQRLLRAMLAAARSRGEFSPTVRHGRAAAWLRPSELTAHHATCGWLVSRGLARRLRSGAYVLTTAGLDWVDAARRTRTR